MDDLISRQAAIDAIEHRLCEPAYQHTGEDWYAGMNCAECELYDLPSAQTEKAPSFTITDKYGHTAEYVKVVRCKDCEHFEERSKYGHGLCHIHCNGVGQCEVVTKMFYCGYPERNDNAEIPAEDA